MDGLTGDEIRQSLLAGHWVSHCGLWNHEGGDELVKTMVTRGDWGVDVCSAVVGA